MPGEKYQDPKIQTRSDVGRPFYWIPDGHDLQAFLDAISDTVIVSAESARLIVLTSCVAGLRVSEVLGLQPIDVDLVKQTLHVERRWRRGDQDEPKSEASRRVRQIGSFASVLLRHAAGKRPDDYLFVRVDGRPLDDRDLQQQVFRPAAEAAGIYHEGFGMHVFRRLNVTWRQQEGATLIEAQKAAGHTSLDMTMLYTQTEDQRERDQVERIIERLGLTEKKPAEAALKSMKAAGGVQ